MLASFLPIAVKSRLPRLPSLRRKSSSLVYGLESRSAPASGARTPEEEFSDELVVATGGAMYASEEEGDITTRKGTTVREEESGIDWKFANRGMNSLAVAVDEASTLSTTPRFGNASFARQAYIHALVYLLQGLPTNLGPEERLSIRTALPAGVVPSPSSSYSSTEPAPSLLHRTLAFTIIQLFLLFQFLLPYIKYFVGVVYEYEREHKIGETVWRTGIEGGKKGVEGVGALLEMGDGRVGKAAAYVVEGVAGGIHEGLGLGMAALGQGNGSALQNHSGCQSERGGYMI